jgi:hypothetical protein
VSDGNVIQFPDGPLGHLVCTLCGCQTWFAGEDGSLTCAGCDQVPEGHARIQVPDAERREQADGEPDTWDGRHFDEQMDGAYDMATRRLAQRLQKGEFAAAIAVKPDGGLHAVTSPGYAVQTDEQRRWLLRALRRGYELITKGS